VRIAFYAPLKAPTHGTPSGDRRVAALYMEALRLAGHRVELVSDFRSYDGAGNPERQRALRSQGLETGRQLAARLAADASARPEVWFTYHVYYKAPDWLGPQVSLALGIPYVIAEASHAPKRASGAWSLGHRAAADAILAASLLVCPTRFDIACLESLIGRGERILLLPPFVDLRPFAEAAARRQAIREKLASEQGLDPTIPWISVAAMMRPGDKMDSYRELASALARVSDLPWQLLIAGDGPCRNEVERALHAVSPGRFRLLGALSLEAVAAMYAASDLCVWPACNEAYGMAMLEAQAAGIPVVSVADRGVPDVVVDGLTGLLAPRRETERIADRVRRLLADATNRAQMGRAAMQHVAAERSLQSAARKLDAALQPLRGVAARVI
jgi:glycosyltransferase involved in cell wall biosynthesis